jgi:hypothetical protein
LLLLSSCLLCPLTFAAEGYYKWLDKRGNPQLSDRPPPSGVAYDYISTSTGMKRRVEAGVNTSPTTSPAPAMPTTAVEPETVAEQQTQITKNPAYCDQAKANLDTLNSNARVRIREKGQVRYLTDEERDIQRRKANDTIAVHCN